MDEGLVEPLMEEQQGYEFPMLDERLLKELQCLDAAENGNSGMDQPPEHVADEEVYKMRELIKEKPKDVIQYLEEEGVVKLGEFDIQDAVAFKALGKDNLMTAGADHYEIDWEPMWRDCLSEYSRSTAGMGWTTKVTMEAHVVNLRDAAAEGSRGLLHPLLKRYQAHGCSAAVFALPAVQAVIHFKWSRWARTFLLYELSCYCAWLVGFTVFTLLFQQEDWTMTFWELMADTNGFLATVFSLLTLVPMAPFVYMELCTVAAYGWGWVRLWNLMDMASYALQIVITVLHIQRDFLDEGWFSVLVATQHVLMWTKLHYFAKAFNPTKTTIIDTIRIVLDDMKWFLLFLTLTMVGFGLAFYALFRQDRDRFMDFKNIWHSFASMFSYMLAMFDYNVFYNSTNPAAAMVLFVMFEFIMNVLLLNILIASMTNSFSKVTQDEGLRFLCSKAEIIDELETTLPRWIKPKSWYPAFVHILKIHPDSTYEVNLNSVWSGMGLMENNLLGAQQETRMRVEELEDRVNKIHKKLDVLIKLFISSMPGQAIGLSRQATGAPAGAYAAYTSGFGPYAGHGGNPFPYMAMPRAAAAATAGIGSSSKGENPGSGPNSGPGAMQQVLLSPMLSQPGLRHTATTLCNLPEQLASVSGPLINTGLNLGGLARRSVPASAASGQPLSPEGHGHGGAAGFGSGGAAAEAAVAALSRSGSGPTGAGVSGYATCQASSSTPYRGGVHRTVTSGHSPGHFSFVMPGTGANSLLWPFAGARAAAGRHGHGEFAVGRGVAALGAAYEGPSVRSCIMHRHGASRGLVTRSHSL